MSHPNATTAVDRLTLESDDLMPPTLDRATSQKLREQHPAWRLLAATNAPFVVGFLHQSFVVPNLRSISRHDLALLLEDHLHDARAEGDLDLPRGAEAYLDEWAGDGAGWLRKFYRPGSDEPEYDLTPATENAIRWVASLLERRVVGTQSRLLTVFRLLTEMLEGAESDPAARLAELQKRRDELNAEMEQIRRGEVPMMDDASIRERFQLMSDTARGILGDFRELEQSFRLLDRDVRQRIASWEGSRGQLLEEILGERDAIASSDQGVSFRAFWDFLMDPERQEELTVKLARVLELDAIRSRSPDVRFRRIHFDWLEAGEITQRTVARLSEQLRRYLDDRAWQENRRILELIRELEREALSLRGDPPRATVAEVDDLAPTVALPLERRLFSPPFVAQIQGSPLEEGEAEGDADALFDGIFVDPVRLRANVLGLLESTDQVSLLDVISAHPLEQGLAELVAYFAPASGLHTVVDENVREEVEWRDSRGVVRVAHVPLLLFTRDSR